MRRALLALGALLLVPACAAGRMSERIGPVDVRYDLTHRPTRAEVGLAPGQRTVVVGRSTDPVTPVTLVLDGGELALRARDVIVDAEPDDGPPAQLVAQLEIVEAESRLAQLREAAPVLGLDPAQLEAVPAPVTLRGGSTGGGRIEVVLRPDPGEGTLFTNIQVTWL